MSYLDFIADKIVYAGDKTRDYLNKNWNAGIGGKVNFDSLNQPAVAIPKSSDFHFNDTTSWNKGERNNKSGKFSRPLLDYIGNEAEKRGIPRHIPQAMAIVETNVGKDIDKETRRSLKTNPLRINYDRVGLPIPDYKSKAKETFPQTFAYKTITSSTVKDDYKRKALDAAFDKHLLDVQQKTTINDALDYLSKGFKKYPTNTTKAIQFYNGEGYIPAGHYGSKVPIHMGKNPVYGKKILEYVEALKRNQDSL